MENEPILRLENIRKTFGHREILKGISLSISKGELKVLIGPSGGGKSTLLQCINFLVMPEEGEIWLEGRKVNRHRKRELYAYRQQVGMIFQDFNLFDHLTALQNVQIALVRVKGMDKKSARERAVAELERVGLGGHIDHYPAQLSGGQKQRVSIARALAMDPKVMLLDEPTSALDPELIGEVLSVIRDLVANGMTMIMATHQIGFSSALATEIIFMEDGLIVEQGPPSKILFSAECARTKEFCSKINELYGEAG
ncbi:amino acid ABC transporter ATP-binding protein [Desulforhabdus amnigena]|jgi:polar amino acid transport system ATP-binding protein|uniref:ATP-binding protein n=1 Tax=Desulforhabdus amnigena TaxID=40218 RepID=A0A9W6CY14_9BACT|nr:amino acid ABC transporter ATP-binding protein [Desulforhabdus amnigena]NLJ29823.1 amino acid ABC transporter ATP-binding protein [Deltaproteobacteria bacterium]GLI33901.1 ATP-binding protein [Desulforhabdus amnigena]